MSSYDELVHEPIRPADRSAGQSLSCHTNVSIPHTRERHKRFVMCWAKSRAPKLSPQASKGRLIPRQADDRNRTISCFSFSHASSFSRLDHLGFPRVTPSPARRCLCH